MLRYNRRIHHPPEDQSISKRTSIILVEPEGYMSQYNWGNLSDYDFELVCRDVLGVILGRPIEGFARGPDGGIDLRYTDTQERVIAQCKHYYRSTFSDLTTALEAEVVKVKNMTPLPTRYILFTTQPLTPRRKDTVLGILSPYCLGTQDILGIEDIEGLLAANSEIEAHHYKLWLASIRVLERIVGNATLTRSQMRVDEITDRARYFVPHQQMPSAEKILRDEHCLIISGPPGIGKTTMAEMLALKLLAAAYRTHFVTRVQELEQEVREGEKQLFIYDDFLGRTNFREAPDAPNQERLFAFMRWIRRKSGKYLILTTREYLYREARMYNERLQESRADIAKCVLGVDGYSDINRARILYNHLYWAEGIPTQALREFVEAKSYWPVIRHPNFNPRLIADMINRVSSSATGQEEEGQAQWT
jgi:hypothetical protein